MKKRIIVLASGGGGTMKFLHRYSQIADAPYEIKSIIADIVEQWTMEMQTV